MLQMVEIVFVAVIFKNVVERPKCHSRLRVPARPKDVILGCKILQGGIGLNFQDIVNDS